VLQGLHAKTNYIVELKSATKFWIFMLTNLWRINCYLFHLWFLRSVAFRLCGKKTLIICYEILCWENGVLQARSFEVRMQAYINTQNTLLITKLKRKHQRVNNHMQAYINTHKSIKLKKK